MRQNKTLAIGLAAVVGASFLGWIAGRTISSPAEEAAATKAPTPSMITVAAERRVLTSDVTARGTVRYGAPQVVSLPTSTLKKNTAIVTSSPVTGAMVTEGSVLLTVSGRPVLVMKGDQPAHRDMGPGTVGDDVRQLEEGLARLGFNTGAVDGTYDTRTATAVTAWYLSLGWTPFGPTEEQLQVLRATQGELFGAQSELLNAHDTLSAANVALATAREKATAAGVAVPAAATTTAAEANRFEADRLKTEAEVAKAADALETAIENDHIARLRLAEGRSPASGPSGAQLDALEAAVARATAAIPVAQADLTAALAGQIAAQRARNVAVAAKQKVLDDLIGANPQDPDAISAAEADLEATIAEADANGLRAAAEVAAKRAAVNDAGATLRNAELVLAEATSPGGPQVSPAELAALAATARQSSSAVGAARTDLAVANAMLGAFSASAPTSGGTLEATRAAANAEVAGTSEAVSVAQRRVALVSTRATEIATTQFGGKLGTQVPADELTFFPTLPVRIDEAKVKLGDQVGGPTVSVTNSEVAVDAGLSIDDAKLIRAGATVTINDPDLGTKAAGVVTAVADAPGTNGVDPQRYYLQVTPTEGAPGLLVGASVVLTITVDSTEGDVLTVPIAALSVAADGTPRAQVQNKDGSTRFVAVAPGLTSKGLVAVSPVHGDQLTAGDLVVVGAAGAAATPTAGAAATPTTKSP